MKTDHVVQTSARDEIVLVCIYCSVVNDRTFCQSVYAYAPFVTIVLSTDKFQLFAIRDIMTHRCLFVNENKIFASFISKKCPSTYAGGRV